MENTIVETKFIDEGFFLTIVGGDGKTIGKLFQREGKLIFEGEVGESAKIFFENVVALYDPYIKKLQENGCRCSPNNG